MSDVDTGPTTRAVVTAFPSGVRHGQGHPPGSLVFDDLMRRFFMARAARSVILDEAFRCRESADEILQRLMMTPAPEPRHLRFKLKLFSEELQSGGDDAGASSARVMAFYAALQADVLRFLVDPGSAD